MTPVTRFVQGYRFSENENGLSVALVAKQRGPACVIGKLIGVGGKVNVGEPGAHAMAREFAEEATLLTTPSFGMPPTRGTSTAPSLP